MNYTNALDIHIHPFGENFSIWSPDVIQLYEYAKTYAKPVWATEIGTPNVVYNEIYRLHTKTANIWVYWNESRFIQEVYSLLLSLNITHIFWFTLYNINMTSGNLRNSD